MKTVLEPTGERMMEEAYHQTLGGYVIYILHSASYKFAEQFCHGRRVLDLGCGSGYGASRIADIASSVHAVDISEEAIQFASQNYPKQNLHFSTIEPDSALPFQNNSFDVVLSFQVIEHVTDHHQYLEEASRVLVEGGTLVLITPDRKNRLFPFQKPWNRWHLREYDAKTLTNLTSKCFNIVNTLEMGARDDIADVELKRYKLLKWITLFATLPFLPESYRQFCLNLIHRIKPQSKTVSTPKTKFDFGIDAVRLSPKEANSLNLVIVATTKQKSK